MVVRKTLGILALGLALAVAVAAPARASSGVASGTFAFVSDDVQFRGVVGANLVFTEVAVIAYDGGLSGVATDADTLVVHPDGSFSSHGTENCTLCTLAGHRGSFTSSFVFSGSGTSYRGALTFTGGTGGLAGLHGGGPFQGDENGNTYSYAYSSIG